MKQKIIYALGFFDGVHLGHQALLAATIKLAAHVEAVPGVVTFSSHPDGLVFGKTPGLLTTGEVRNELLRIYGMKQVLELPFDREVMNTHWASFLSQLADAGAVGFVCGDDFRFGSGGLGTPKKLEAFCKKRGLAYAIVSQRTQDGIRVSSTHIRALLEQGAVKQVNLFLGHPYFLTGTVVEGRQLGRTIGVPTANVLLPPELAVPKLGVYACKAEVDGKLYTAVTNIGSRPTVGGHQVRAESWLLDFDGDLYGKRLTLAFHHFLREEKKFDSLEDLKEQVLRDAQQARKLLG